MTFPIAAIEYEVRRLDYERDQSRKALSRQCSTFSFILLSKNQEPLHTTAITNEVRKGGMSLHRLGRFCGMRGG